MRAAVVTQLKILNFLVNEFEFTELENTLQLLLKILNLESFYRKT